MWIKILCIEYILWGIPTIESTFEFANMVKTGYCERCANKKLCASKHTGLLNSCLGKLCLLPYLVVPLISARVTLISTRVSAHCHAILLKVWSYLCRKSYCGDKTVVRMLCLHNGIFYTGKIPDSKVHGANVGPIWGRQDPGGPHVGPMNFAIWDGISISNQPSGYTHLHQWTW